VFREKIKRRDSRSAAAQEAHGGRRPRRPSIAYRATPPQARSGGFAEQLQVAVSARRARTPFDARAEFM
jgi:hypothetical protein